MLIWKRLTDMSQWLPLKLLFFSGFQLGTLSAKICASVFSLPCRSVGCCVMCLVRCEPFFSEASSVPLPLHQINPHFTFDRNFTSPPTCSSSTGLFPRWSRQPLASLAMAGGDQSTPTWHRFLPSGLPAITKICCSLPMKYTSQLNSPDQTSRSRSKCYGEHTSIFESNF